MSEPDDDSTDRRLDEALGRLLQGGVILAATVVLVGGVLHLAGHAHDPEGHRTFDPRPDELCHPVGVVRSAVRGEPRGIIQLGLLLLIATPVARVLFTVFAFLRQRDRTYTLITLAVLGLLLYSLFWGK
ncbi:MAG TPA: DUF1634 domain-containing protein [Gemmataceae bacterium]|nr:DUF1634 domain-containing protein [Gemmataceae bacterium]